MMYVLEYVTIIYEIKSRETIYEEIYIIDWFVPPWVQYHLGEHVVVHWVIERML